MSHVRGASHMKVPWTALLVLGSVLTAAIVGPALIAVDPLHQNLMATSLPPSSAWLLGTDELGRSVLTRTVA